MKLFENYKVDFGREADQSIQSWENEARFYLH